MKRVQIVRAAMLRGSALVGACLLGLAAAWLTATAHGQPPAPAALLAERLTVMQWSRDQIELEFARCRVDAAQLRAELAKRPAQQDQP